MQFDRPIDCPPNQKRASGHHFENVYVGTAFLQARAAPGGKWVRFGSADSEDAVTWNALVGLLGSGDVSVTSAVPGLAGCDLPMKDAAILLWNVPLARDSRHAELERLLRTTQGKLEANPRRVSEVEVVIWNERRNLLTFIEAKLTSGPGACLAVSSSPGVRKPDADCRMFRTCKRPQDNGCSYWGLGTGGTAFSQRFPKDYVRAHLGFDPPARGREEQAPCARLYQLMRNALIGREMADAVAMQGGSPAEFQLIAIVAKGYFKSDPYLEFARAINDAATIRFGVVTWQGIREAVRQSGCQPEVVEYLERHTCL